jgi:hypothetical protein
MRGYKATYRDRDGKKRRSAKWYLDFPDHNRLRHKIPAFADKRLSEALGRNIEALVKCRIAGLEPDAKLNQWIETVPDSLLRKSVSWGLLDGQRTEITKPLTEHIGDYVKALKAKALQRTTLSEPETSSTRLSLIAGFTTSETLHGQQSKFIREVEKGRLQQYEQVPLSRCAEDIPELGREERENYPQPHC